MDDDANLIGEDRRIVSSTERKKSFALILRVAELQTGCFPVRYNETHLRQPFRMEWGGGKAGRRREEGGRRKEAVFFFCWG